MQIKKVLLNGLRILAGASSTGGTATTAINAAGAITGHYTVDQPGCCPHSATTFGFVRTPDGTFTTFAVPGADVADASTIPFSINSSGTITGYYSPEPTVTHSFARTPDGAIPTFDPPNTNQNIGSGALSINNAGAITGFYGGDASQKSFIHGYLRSPDGTFTSFDAPGTPTETAPCCINASGTIAGTADHPFLRARNGTLTSFDFLGNIGGINPRGSFVGNYATENPSQLHGYVQNPTAPSSRLMPLVLAPAPIAYGQCRRVSTRRALSRDGMTTQIVLATAFWRHRRG